MASKIRMGYLGYATVDNTGFFLTGSSLNAAQTVAAPDLVAAKEVRRGWNMGKVEIGGNFSGPLHENASTSSYSFVRLTIVWQSGQSNR